MSKPAHFTQHVMDDDYELRRHITRLVAVREQLDEYGRRQLELLLKHCAQKDWLAAANIFRGYFMNDILQTSIDFDKEINFERIMQILERKSESQSASAAAPAAAAPASPPAKKAKKSLRGTKACPVCGTRWGTRKKKCDKCGYEFISISNKNGDDSSAAATVVSSSATKSESEDSNSSIASVEPSVIERAIDTRQESDIAPDSPDDVDEKVNDGEAKSADNGGEAKSAANDGEAKEDAFDSPRPLDTGGVVEIRLKPLWMNKLMELNGGKFIRGQGDDKKAVKKIYAILTKENVKKYLADLPGKSLKSWQNKNIREEWKATRDGKPPPGKDLDESDPLVVHWRQKKPDKPTPLPTFIPEAPFEFLVEDMNETTISVFLEDADDSGNFKFKFKSDILMKYVEWRKLPDLEEGDSDEKIRFQAALDCLHTFGGAGKPFSDDTVSLTILSDYSKKMDVLVKKARKALDKRLAEHQNAGGEFKDPELRQLDEKWRQAYGAANWDRDPPLVFDANFVEITSEELSSMDAQAVEQYLENEQVQRQLFIRQWATTCAMLQLPDGTKRGKKAQLLEIQFEGDPTWYNIKVVRTDLANSVVEYAYIDPPDDGQDWSNGELDFALDTFRLVHAKGDDETVSETSIISEDADQIADDDEEDQAESSDDEEDADDPMMGEDVFVQYISANGDLIVGKALAKRIRQDVATDDNLRVTDPYEYDVDGIWVGSENLSRQDDDDYQAGDEVFCPDGVTRTIESTDGDLAFFADYAGDDGITFDELDEAKLEAQDADELAAVKEQERVLHEVDTQKTRKWRGRTVRVIEPLEPFLTRVKKEEKTPPFNVPYKQYSDKEWTEMKKGEKQGKGKKRKKPKISKDAQQVELVDLQDVSTNEIFRQQIADELDQDDIVQEADDDSDVEQGELETNDAAEQKADAEMSSDDAASSEEDEPVSEPDEDIIDPDAVSSEEDESEEDISDAGDDTDVESEDGSDED